MPSRFATGKRDANEAEILEYLARRNIRSRQMHEGDGCDLLILIHPMELWEIKNPDQPPSKQKLTQIEEDTQVYCNEAGIPYIVITSIEEAEARIAAYFERH